jgi:AraC-like DNA-binding protein
VACYREFAPSEELREHVRAFFAFTPAGEVSSTQRPITREILFDGGDPFTAPTFASAQSSIVVNFARRCEAGGVWVSCDAPNAQVLGAMTGAGAQAAGFFETVGVYFQPARGSMFTGMPLCELTDQIVSLDAVWGRGATANSLPAELGEMDQLARIDRFESELVRRFRRTPEPRTAVDVPGLALWTQASGGRVSVARLADEAGVSRQQLTRVFRESVGVSPKLYCRLARFQAALGHSGARVATALGYADQSHMIAEFREFSSLTPHQIASARLFHPFIENAKTAG